MNDQAGTKSLLKKRVELPSQADALLQVMELIESINLELGIKDDVYGNVVVAVTEAVNNSLLHGNKEDPDKRIRFEAFLSGPYRFCVRVSDEGEGFDPDSLPDPTAPENLENIGGRGVFLMRHLADELYFHDGGRCVEMVFNI